MRQPKAPEDDFVRESNGSVAGTLFEARYGGDPPSRLIASTAHFGVLADLAPLCEGHLLIVPRAYRPSFGALPADWWPELDALLAMVGETLAAAFDNEPWVVEHGSSSQLRRSPCVTHAHLHLLPVPVDLADDLRARGAAPREIGSLHELAAMARRDRSYLCWGPASGPLGVVDVEDGVDIPRQYVRRHLGAALGQETWDWGVPSPPELLRATVRSLHPMLARVQEDRDAAR